MIGYNSYFLTAIREGNKNYDITITFTLANGEELTMTSSDIWQGGLILSDSISEEGRISFGAVIAKKLTLNIINYNEKWNEYDFTNADVKVEIGLADIDNKSVFMGYCNTAKYSKNTMNITATDYISLLDKLWVKPSGMSDTPTVKNVIDSITQQTWNWTWSNSLPNDGVAVKITSENTSNVPCATLLSEMLQLCGAYVVQHGDGSIERQVLSLNGLTPVYINTDAYNPETDENVHYIHKNEVTEVNADVENINVTGFRAITYEDGLEYLAGSTGYVLGIANNPYVDKDNYQAIANGLETWYCVDGHRLNFRAYSVKTFNNPNIECGDVCIVEKPNGYRYLGFVSNMKFEPSATMSVSCDAESARTINARSYSGIGRQVSLNRDAISSVNTSIKDPESGLEATHRIAKEAKEAVEAQEQIVWKDDDGIHVSTDKPIPETSESNKNILINAFGVIINKAKKILAGFTGSGIAFYDGEVPATAEDLEEHCLASFTTSGAVIGKVNGDHAIINEDGFRNYHNNELIAHLGYGETVSETGEIVERPYYTLGIRKAGEVIGAHSVAEGYDITASGVRSHAEGNNTSAIGVVSHAEGALTEASGNWSHAEGYDTKAIGSVSHAEGEVTEASGKYSHAEGLHTKTIAEAQHVQGKYNIGRTTTLFEIGNGTEEETRSNAFEVYTDGTTNAANSYKVTDEVVAGLSSSIVESITFNTSNFTKSYVYFQSDGHMATLSFNGTCLKSGNNTVMTLPEGYRPKDAKYFLGVTNSSSVLNHYLYGSVSPNGNVNIITQTSGLYGVYDTTFFIT